MDYRPSPIAGRWYPGDSGQLASSVDAYVDAADLPEIKGEVIGIIAPHAGHAHQAYQTPLGPIIIDQEAVTELNGYIETELGFGLTPVRNDAEHSLEIELPFLQRVIRGEFRLLPVMVRDQTSKVGEALGTSLARVLANKDALLVASSDLSHFYNQEQAVQLDMEMLHQIEAFDPQGILRAEEEGKGFACGRIAVAAVLWAAREMGANTVQILKHATSGDVTGDYSGVVGYGAAVITRYETEVSPS
jgi:AmmeMemoRadiSam system protein B